jgi:glycosyltransferase involved in cell wall biosynthesis
MRPLSILHLLSNRWWTGTAEPVVPLVGTVTRLAASRGHLALVEVFAQVHTAIPAARLLIVGKGEFRPQLEQGIGELGLGEAVIFTGYREEDLPEVLAALDAPGKSRCARLFEAGCRMRSWIAPSRGSASRSAPGCGDR